MTHAVFFYLFSAGIVVFSIGVLVCRSPIYAILSLVGAIGLTSALFVLLGATLLAMILLLVYVGAILVLFLFAMMMLDLKDLESAPRGNPIQVLAATLFGVGLFALILRVLFSAEIASTALRPMMVQGSTPALGKLLFGPYVLPFELTSFLLLAAVLSVVVLARKERLP